MSWTFMLALLTNDRAGPRAVWNDRKPSTRRELESAIDGIAARRTRLRCASSLAMWGLAAGGNPVRRQGARNKERRKRACGCGKEPEGSDDVSAPKLGSRMHAPHNDSAMLSPDGSTEKTSWPRLGAHPLHVAFHIHGRPPSASGNADVADGQPLHAARSD
jgi:hypothetical protein